MQVELRDPSLDVGQIETRAANLENAGNVAKLSLRLAGPGPFELRNDRVLGRSDEDLRIFDCGKPSSLEFPPGPPAGPFQPPREVLELTKGHIIGP